MDEHKMKKLALFEKNKDLAHHVELVETNEHLEEMHEIAEGQADRTDETNRLLAEIAAKEMPEFPEIPAPPDEVSIKNLPEVQKVQVMNMPEQKAPVVNVPAPIVNVKAPEVVIPLEGFAGIIEKLKDKLFSWDKNESRDVVVVDRDGQEVDWSKLLAKEVGSGFKWLGGGGGASGKVNVRDTTGLVINPRKEDGHGSAIGTPTYAQITNPGAIGGGTEYTEGDTDASITGGAIMWEDTGDTLRAVSAAKPLPVGDAGGSITVDGSITTIGLSAIDANNSTTATLGSGATFTGAWTDVSEYQAVQLQVFSNAASADDGLVFETSPDGTNADHDHAHTYTGGSVGKHFEESLPAKYFRIKYTNSSTVQTVFRLQSKLLKTAATAHVHPANADLDITHPAAVTRAIIAGETTAGGGALVNVKVNPSGTLETNANTELPAAAALADNTSNPTAPAVGSFGHLWDGSTWDRAPGNSTDGTLVNLGANNDVTVTSSALPSGAATSAKQDTIIGHVDGIEGLLTTIDADTGTIAGAVSGTEMQVDVVAALPAGDNNIGNIDLASAIPAGTNNIGDVDVLTLPSIGLVSTNNSTTATLTSGSTYTGTFEEITDYASIDVLLKSDQDSAASGARLDFSNDGITAVRTITTTYLTAAGGIYLSIPVEARYFRIRYTNGGTTGNGYELSAGDSVDLDVSTNKQIWAIAVSGTQTVCMIQAGS